MAFFIKRIIPISFLGLLSGFLNGLLDAGGGIPLVMGMHLILCKKLANGRRIFTTALATTLPLSLFSLYLYNQKAPLPTDLFAALLFPAIAGGALGAILLGRLPTRVATRIFATVVALSGIFLLF